jgi:hypothetical protein
MYPGSKTNNHLVGFFKGDAHRINAVAITGWGLWGILENVTKVRAAGSASNFSAHCSKTSIFQKLDRVLSLWFVETWPATVRLELGSASKKLCLATPTAEDSRAVLVQKLSGESSFGPRLAKHLVLKIT